MCLSGHRKYPIGSEKDAVRQRGMEIMGKAVELADDLGIRIIQLAGYDVWYAEYGVSQPTGKFDFVMWQYSDTGLIPGVVTSAGQVDLNIRFLVA